MPKRSVTLTDFSGGLNTDKSPRSLEDNELARLYGIWICC